MELNTNHSFLASAFQHQEPGRPFIGEPVEGTIIIMNHHKIRDNAPVIMQRQIAGIIQLWRGLHVAQPAFAWQSASAPLCSLSLGKMSSTRAFRTRASCRAGCSCTMTYEKALHRWKAYLLRCENLVRSARCDLHFTTPDFAWHARARATSPGAQGRCHRPCGIRHTTATGGPAPPVLLSRPSRPATARC